MKWRAICCLALAILLSGHAAAREWTSRDGKHTVEAELINAKDDTATLKRSDGKLIKVPFSQLSLGDLHYVREAMQDAGEQAEPTNESPFGAPIEDDPESKPESGTSEEDSANSQSVAPETDNHQTGWRVKPDPSSIQWSIANDQQIEIDLAASFRPDSVVFAGGNGPFVAIANKEDDDVRDIWDLRVMRRTGSVTQKSMAVSNLAVSPDGQHMATTSLLGDTNVQLWSFKTGKMVRRFEADDETPRTGGLDFAGTKRLVGFVSSKKAIFVWDVSTGKILHRINWDLAMSQEEYAVSPGGNYLALLKRRGPIEIYDLNQGSLAGKLEFPDSSKNRLYPVAIDFSGDGGELAVVDGLGSEKKLFCWSMKDGSLVAEHLMVEKISSVSTTLHGARRRFIDWIPNNKGWLIFGAVVVDRNIGGPVWIAKDKYGHPDKGPRRVVDENHTLAVTGDYGKQKLVLEEIPWEKANSVREVLSTGGLAKDAGLPPLTAADWSAVGKLPRLDESGVYQPDAMEGNISYPAEKSIEPGRQGTEAVKAAFSSREAGRLLVSGSSTGSHPADPTSKRTAYSDVYDLNTGKRLSRIDIGFSSEQIDFSPSGKLAVYRHNNGKDRLDVFEVETGKHVVGFRPYLGRNSEYNQEVRSVSFVDDEHLMTSDRSRLFTLWEIPECKAVHTIEARSDGAPTCSRDRKYLALSISDVVHIIDALSGKSCAQLQVPSSGASSIIVAGEFRQDGEQFAAQFFADTESCQLVVWEIATGKIRCDVRQPFRCQQIMWVGPDHVLLHRTNVRFSTGRGVTSKLIDLPSQRVVWNYVSDIECAAMSGPDDRCWCFPPLGKGSASRLTALELPGSKVIEVFEASTPPKPILGPDTRIAFNVEVDGLPSSLLSSPEQEALKAELARHFKGSLAERGVTVDPGASTIFNVSLKKQTEEEVVKVRDRYNSRSYKTLTTIKKIVVAEVSVKSADGKLLWQDTRSVSAKDVEPIRPSIRLPSRPTVPLPGRLPGRLPALPPSLLPSRTPEKEPSTEDIEKKQWEAAKNWCLLTVVPNALYAPEAYAGLGESKITADGAVFLRTYD